MWTQTVVAAVLCVCLYSHVSEAKEVRCYHCQATSGAKVGLECLDPFDTVNTSMTICMSKRGCFKSKIKTKDVVTIDRGCLESISPISPINSTSSTNSTKSTNSTRTSTPTPTSTLTMASTGCKHVYSTDKNTHICTCARDFCNSAGTPYSVYGLLLAGLLGLAARILP